MATKANVIAKFKGVRGSMNYFPGFEYKLEMIEDRTTKNIISISDISETIMSKPKGEPCQYESIASFLKNWEIKDVKILES